MGILQVSKRRVFPPVPDREQSRLIQQLGSRILDRLLFGLRMTMTTAEIVAWADEMEAAGKRDAMGIPFTSWLVARYQPDGSAMRDQAGRQAYETQAEFKARQGQSHPVTHTPVGQTLDLFV